MVNDMIAVIRIRGSIGMKKELLETLNMLGLKKANTLSVLPRSDSIIGMIKKAEHLVTWGEISKENIEKMGKNKTMNLKPPKGGFRSVRTRYPKGDTGYRGEKINDLINKMMK